MRLAALHQVFEPEVELPHLAQRSAGRQQVQPGPVLARDEVGDVTRRHPQPFTSELHATPPCSARLRAARHLCRLRRARHGSRTSVARHRRSEQGQG